MQPVEVLFASGDFFSTLGVRAIVGRTFTAADDVRGGGPDGAVVVISHDLWQRRFNGAAGAVGSRLLVNGTPLTIVGVAPRRFRGVDVGQPFDIAIPFGAEPLIRGRRSLIDDRSLLLLTLMVRLKAGQSMSAAAAALRAMQPQILGADAPPFLKEPFLVVPASTGISDRSRLRQQYERPLIILSIVAGFVVLIVSVNIANLFLARATARRQELSVRLAVGAPRWRLVRQLFVEGLLLATVSAVAGTLIAAWASRALVAHLPAAGAPVVIDLPIDWRVLTFTIAATMAAVVLFATAPALYAMRVPSLEAVQEAGRGAGGRRTGLLSSGMVVTQVALSLVLLAAAGMFARTLNRLANVPLGFDPKGVLVITVNAARADVDPATRLRVYERIIEAVAAVPGVTRAAGSVWTPVGTGGGGLLTDARGRRADVGRQVAFNIITPGWFATYGTAFQTGRDFDAGDGTHAVRVAIVNETLNRSLLRDRNAEASTIDAGPCRGGGCTVIGVVADAVYGRSFARSPAARRLCAARAIHRCRTVACYVACERPRYRRWSTSDRSPDGSAARRRTQADVCLQAARQRRRGIGRPGAPRRNPGGVLRGDRVAALGGGTLWRHVVCDVAPARRDRHSARARRAALRCSAGDAHTNRVVRRARYDRGRVCLGVAVALRGALAVQSRAARPHHARGIGSDARIGRGTRRMDSRMARRARRSRARAAGTLIGGIAMWPFGRHDLRSRCHQN